MAPFFVWIRDFKGMSIPRLAKTLGYSPKHMYRIRDGESPCTRSFAARAILEFGDEVRPFFFDTVPVTTDITATTAGMTIEVRA